jgi:uncharacterized protein YqhQ
VDKLESLKYGKSMEKIASHVCGRRTMSGSMTKVLKWLDTASYLKLILTYLVVSVVVIVLGIFIFFPILLIYSALGMEFSNLGPIATFVWGVLFEIFVITPLFIISFVVKLIRRHGR